ncbi:hypothetical protein [Mesorhizobium temperatum]|nr:hypothetical protein [Mesorhizobium temperatum]
MEFIHISQHVVADAAPGLFRKVARHLVAVFDNASVNQFAKEVVP